MRRQLLGELLDVLEEQLRDDDLTAEKIWGACETIDEADEAIELLGRLLEARDFSILESLPGGDGVATIASHGWGGDVSPALRALAALVVLEDSLRVHGSCSSASLRYFVDHVRQLSSETERLCEWYAMCCLENTEESDDRPEYWLVQIILRTHFMATDIAAFLDSLDRHRWLSDEWRRQTDKALAGNQGLMHQLKMLREALKG